MTPKVKKIVLISIPIVTVILAITIAILYITTDFLKPNRTLFFKYMSQNVDAAKAVIDNKTEKEYSNILKQAKYNSTSQLSATYIENINTSEESKKNEINKLKMKIKKQSEYQNNYLYEDMNVDYNDTEIFRAEYIHNNDKYGVRFPKKFSQFLVVENHDLKQVATDAKIDEKNVEIMPDNIQEYDINNVISFTDEEIETLKTKYLDIISSNITNNNFSKQKNVMITVNEQTIYTNVYSLTLTHEQANDIYLKILEELKNDEIIIKKISELEPISMIINLIINDEKAYNKEYLKQNYDDLIEKEIDNIQKNNIGTNEVIYTVYQSKGTTVRTQIIEDTKEITLDLISLDNNNIEINIKNQNNNQEKENLEKIKIIKNNNDETAEFSIDRKKTIGDITSNVLFYRNKEHNDNRINLKTGINYKNDEENLLEIELNEEIDLSDELNNKLDLDNKNSVIINNYEGELVSSWIGQVMEYLNKTKADNEFILSSIKEIDLVKKILNIPENVVIIEPTETTEVDKNRFNAKFEFYTGKEKKGEEVKKLIEEAKTSFKNAQVSYSNEGNTEGTKKLQNVKINVEKDANEVELANSIKEMIEDTDTYTVEVNKNSNGIIDTILITVNKK